MKILRKRSGFTTNSSSSSEWVPDIDPALEENPDNSESGTIQQDQPAVPPGLPLWGKTLMSIGIIVFIVAGLFLLERFVRKIRKRIKDAQQEDDCD